MGLAFRSAERVALYIASFRYLVALIISFFLIILSAAPLADGSISLIAHEIKVTQANHRQLQASICNVTDKLATNYEKIGLKLPSTVTYRVNTDSAPSSIRSSLSTIVNNSVQVWDGKISVSFGNGGSTSVKRASNDGQNIIAWNRLSRNTLGATYIWYNSATKTVVNVDTIMNSRHPWAWTNPNSTDPDQNCSNPNSYDAQNILTHELGHWVGLDDLYGSADEDNTMYGYGAKGELKKDTLETGDVNGAQSIY